MVDEFISYGQSLGLGMNWEQDHIDVSVLGDQWEGEFAGHNFGGFRKDKSQKTSSSRQPSNEKVSTENQTSTNNDGDSIIDGIIKNLLTSSPEAQPAFDMKGERKLEKEFFRMFVEDRKNTLEGDDAAEFLNFLEDNQMLNKKGEFKQSKENRDLLRKEFGEEIQEYGDNKIIESYNRHIQSQQSANEKIRNAFAELVQREVNEGKPEAMKHQKILQDDNIGAMTVFLQDAGIDVDNVAKS